MFHFALQKESAAFASLLENRISLNTINLHFVFGFSSKVKTRSYVQQ